MICKESLTAFRKLCQENITYVFIFTWYIKTNALELLQKNVFLLQQISIARLRSLIGSNSREATRYLM